MVGGIVVAFCLHRGRVIVAIEPHRNGEVTMSLSLQEKLARVALGLVLAVILWSMT